MKPSIQNFFRISFLFIPFVVYLGTTSLLASSTTSITPIEPFEIGVYPNPANSYLSINYRSTDIAQGNAMVTFTVINLVGKRFITVQKDCGLDCEFQVNTSQYPPGVYFLLVEWQGQRSTRKFTILH